MRGWMLVLGAMPGVAHAGVSMTLNGPGYAIRGAPVSWQVVGAPANQTLALLASTTTSGPFACPPVIAPTCLGLRGNPTVVTTRRANAGGTATFNLTLPPTFAASAFALQSGYILGGGGAQLTGVRFVRVIDAGGDEDGDGLINQLEAQIGTDPFLADTDGDLLTDAEERAIGSDPLAPDTDGDGLPDADEVRLTFTSPLAPDTDSDGIGDADDDEDADGLSNVDEISLYGTNPVLADTDADGLGDGVELGLGLDPLRYDTDQDGTGDGQEDADGDGLVNLSELAVGTDPMAYDTDGDGLSDGLEVTGLGTSPLAVDSDGDGVGDGDEDADLDGLSSAAEESLYGTLAYTFDTDADGLGDGWEVSFSRPGRLLNPTLYDTDADGVFDGGEDYDGDALTEAYEVIYGTSPDVADSDGDGVPDGIEVLWTGTNPLVVDTDGDGVGDGAEDPDADGLSSAVEVGVWGTNPVLADSDSDALPDGWEVQWSTFARPLIPTNPDSDGDGTFDWAEDGDLDGLGEQIELNLGANPSDPDSDNDGLPDGVEHNLLGTSVLVVDTDGDGQSDAQEDPDGDGLPSGVEVNTYGSNPIAVDSDSDGLPDGWEVANSNVFLTLSPALADSDGDGVSDGAEDPDNDTLPMVLEYNYGSDPYNPDSDYDGANDAVESQAGTDLLDADSDNGGVYDGDELIAGLNPLAGADDAGWVAPLMITEVCDPPGVAGARFVEVFNPSFTPVALSGWAIRRYSNGGTTPTAINLSAAATLYGGEAWVVANTGGFGAGSFFSYFEVPPSQANANISGNGDDVYALARAGVNVDVYGEIGVDGTGTAWEYTGGTAKRAGGVMLPTATFDVSQWELYPGADDAFPFFRE